VATAKKLAGSDRVQSDADLEAHIQPLRKTLTKYEQQIYRELGKDCGEIIGAVSKQVRPTMTEWEIASALSAACWPRGITPVVMLVAADERVDAIRHPLPTNKRIKNKVMIVLCGRRAGFVLSCTRIVYVTTTPGAKVPEDLLRRHDAATYVDAVAILKSKPGVAAKDVFQSIQDAYESRGFPGEWKLHHQGGCAGYLSREWIATPTHSAVVGANQGFAWNPSVTGTKSEDTVLLYEGDDGKLVHEIISASPDWPLIEHEVDGVRIQRPGILHIAY
jgi:Xaa-Pro dipeptidase